MLTEKNAIFIVATNFLIIIATMLTKLIIILVLAITFVASLILGVKYAKKQVDIGIYWRMLGILTALGAVIFPLWIDIPITPEYANIFTNSLVEIAIWIFGLIPSFFFVSTITLFICIVQRIEDLSHD